MANTNAEQHRLQFSPFRRIALALSGGGFRAAAYNLGVMSLLNQIRIGEESLLKRVVYLSSASGGTITSAFYTTYNLNERPFSDCYRDLLRELHGEKILTRALDILKDDGQWESGKGSKNRNLINSFSKVYDERLFHGQSLSIIEEQKIVKEFSVCFNCTDFFRGLSFRFQMDNNPRSREFLGNGAIYLDRKAGNGAYKRLKFSDILAASSCFPAGFEPMVYPEDFTYAGAENQKALTFDELKDSTILEKYTNEKKVLDRSYGLMDGGITDNQALNSAMLANQRSSGNFDLIVVSDVASYFMDPYVAPEVGQSGGSKSIKEWYDRAKRLFRKVSRGIAWGISLSAITICCSVALVAFGNEALVVTGYILFGFSVATLLISMVAKWIKSKLIKSEFFDADIVSFIEKHLRRLNIAQNFSPDIIRKLLTYLGETKFNVLQQMLKARLYSVLIMVMDINLKHVRSLIYDRFFDDIKYENKRVYNVIYELSSHNRQNRTYRVNRILKWATESDRKELLDNLNQIGEVAERARTMGTTLWFDSKDEGKLKDLVACGQFTVCSNLLEYILSIERQGAEIDPADQASLAEVKKQVTQWWGTFKENPFALYDELNEAG